MSEQLSKNEKISLALRGRKFSEERRENISASLRGKCSDKQRENLARVREARWSDPAQKEKASLRMKGAANPVWKEERDPARPWQTLDRKIARLHRSILGSCLWRMGRRKSSQTIDALGYSADQLKEHLELHFLPGMSWENYGRGVGRWSVDHVQPICSFSRDSDTRVVNALSNLRPLWVTENSQKGARYG